MFSAVRMTLIFITILTAPAFAQEIATKSAEVTLVLWTAGDCRYCASWKGSLGGKGDLTRWPGFAKISYVEIERPGLRGSFTVEHFGPEQAWLRDDALPSHRASSFVPAWSIYVDKVHVLSGVGTKEWDRVVFPKLKDIVEKKGTES
jgi:hypothetical protein